MVSMDIDIGFSHETSLRDVLTHTVIAKLHNKNMHAQVIADAYVSSYLLVQTHSWSCRSAVCIKLAQVIYCYFSCGYRQ